MRIIEVLVIVIILPLLFILNILIFLLGFLSTKNPIYSQERLGKNRETFKLYKFRTMRLDTKSVSTHLVDKSAITTLGKHLRRFKLDELPQLFNIIKGQMSLVGPRPNLPNQFDVIKMREKYGVYKVKPGITGLAQIRQIDMSTPELLAKTDAEMIRNMSAKNYFLYLWLTFIGRGGGDRIK